MGEGEGLFEATEEGTEAAAKEGEVASGTKERASGMKTLALRYGCIFGRGKDFADPYDDRMFGKKWKAEEEVL